MVSTGESSQHGDKAWQGIAKRSLNTSDGDASVILGALQDYDTSVGLSRNWFVSVSP